MLQRQHCCSAVAEVEAQAREACTAQCSAHPMMRVLELAKGPMTATRLISAGLSGSVSCARRAVHGKGGS